MKAYCKWGIHESVDFNILFISSKGLWGSERAGHASQHLEPCDPISYAAPLQTPSQFSFNRTFLLGLIIHFLSPSKKLLDQVHREQEERYLIIIKEGKDTQTSYSRTLKAFVSGACAAMFTSLWKAAGLFLKFLKFPNKIVTKHRLNIS